MQYAIALLGMIAGFIGGYFFNAPPECPKIEECDRGIIDRAFDKAVKNCANDTGWEDYECFRFMNTGRAPATPTPKPTPTAAPKPDWWNIPKGKLYEDDESDSE